MLALSAQLKIYIAIEPVDFRNGIDGIGGICRNKLGRDPSSGAYFVFRNKRKTTIKILAYDGNGFWLCTKRLSRGRLKWWPTAASHYSSLKMAELQTIIMGGDPKDAEFGSDWKKLLR